MKSQVEEEVFSPGIYLSPESRKALLHRLNRIEGQVRALKKGVQEGRCADDLLILAAAVRGAITQVIAKILEDHLMDCARTCMRAEGNLDEVYERIARALATVLKNS